MEILKEIDEDGSGEIEFAEFCQLCAKFLVEDPDIETMKRELKDAFREAEVVVAVGFGLGFLVLGFMKHVDQ